MNEKVAFVLCIENNNIRDQAVLLIESIRAFAGTYRDAEIIAVSPRGRGVDLSTRKRLDELRVFYVDLPLNVHCPEYGAANRVYAAAWAAQNCRASTLVVLDSDTVFLGEPELLESQFDVAARPVDLKGLTSTGPGDPREDYFAALCAFAGKNIEVLPFIETTIDGRRVRATYNGGYLVVRRESGIFELAAEVFTRSLMHQLRPGKGTTLQVVASTGSVGPVASEYWGAGQAATSVAIWSLCQRVKLLDDRYNVPLHLLRPENLGDRWSGISPIHAHYHQMLTSEYRSRTLELLRLLAVSAEVIDWLAERTPLPSDVDG